MKLLLNAMPIFGITIDTGEIQKFTNEEDALSFFQNKDHEISTTPTSIAIKKKTDQFKTKAVMPWEISKEETIYPRKELK
ncbi:MAG: hypothetical protein KC646_15915 [Candidatus Cloacimonetes bacterium]|nr:hypothetical protein [Candidatus Cloacimonadota bacterium]